MAVTGFTISKLLIRGRGKPDASLSFLPGLNVIAGASNTGKTYVFQAIDYMLGASRTPKSIPEATGYTNASLELVKRAGGILTIQRSLAGGDAVAYQVAVDAVDGAADASPIGADHEKGNIDTISGRLLALTGLFGKEVRKNARGEKRSLSFRDVAWLALVDEVRIITERSPAISGQYTEGTIEQMVFGLFLTGADDASIIPQEKPVQRKMRLRAELDLLSSLLTTHETRLQTIGVDTASLADQRLRVQGSIQRAIQLLATTQAELDSAAGERDMAWAESRENALRRLFLGEQIKRLRLLREYYLSDRARLESALEAGKVFEQLPSGACPVCGHIVTSDEELSATDSRLIEFQSACNAETAKIGALLADLDDSTQVLRGEDNALANRENELRTTIENANASIEELLNRKARTADIQLSDLLKLEAQLAEASLVASEILDLRTRYSVTEQTIAVRIPKLKIEKKVETRTAARFCEIVAETLKAWKFPYQGAVSFDPVRFDIVIGDQNRGGLGKGYRAVAHAAFTVGLMRYCRDVGLPHPGVVILDTPLNPFKGPDKDSPDRVNQEVQNSFYSDLANDKSGDQVIVFENTEPPSRIRSQIAYTHFSGNPTSGRAGWFPPMSPVLDLGQ